jgi:hypothetical protein
MSALANAPIGNVIRSRAQTEQSDRTYLRLRDAVPERVNRDFGQMLRIK